MKRKNSAILLCAMWLLAAIILCPTAVFAKNAPRQLNLNAKKLTLYVGESETLKVLSVKPEKASDAVVFKSEKPKVASVSVRGQVLAKKAGKTKILVISKKNPKVKAKISIIVKKTPKKTEKIYTLKGGIYKTVKGNNAALQKTFKSLYGNGKKEYDVISTKDAFQEIRKNLKKNGCKDIWESLESFADTDFKNKSLIIMKCSLFRAYDESIAGFSTKFDSKGKLCGTVSIQYKREEDAPGISYPQVMDDYIIVLEISKKDIAMIDYFRCEIENLP